MFMESTSGIEREARRTCASTRRSVVFVELITTAALALSTAIAVTAVSIGIARADVVGAVANGDSTPFAVALLIGLLLSAMGGLTAILAASPCANGDDPS
jgi:hypothetical protein